MEESANRQQTLGSRAENGPVRRSLGGLHRDRLSDRARPAGLVDLNELHHGVHPWAVAPFHRSPVKTDDDLGRSCPEHGSTNLDDFTDRNRLKATKIDHPLEHQIRRIANGSIGRRIGSFKSQRNETARIESAMMIGVSGQDQTMRKSLRGRRFQCSELSGSDKVGT